MKIPKLFFYLIIICLNPVAPAAQGQDILWFNSVPLDRNNGLTSGEYNFYSYQDSEGYVWISSTTGLNRFDGHRVKQYHYDVEDSTSILGEFLQSPFFEDSNKNIWFCTYEAIHCYNRNTDNFQRYFINDAQGQVIKDNYNVFYLEQDSLLWLRAQTGIYTLNIYNPEKSTKVFETDYFHSYVDTNTQGQVQHIISLSNKEAGIEFAEVDNYQIKSKKVFHYKDEEKGDSVKFHEAIIDDLNNIWLASKIGFLKWDKMLDTFQVIKRKVTPYNGISVLDKNHFLLSFDEDSLFKFNKADLSISPYALKSVSDPNVKFNGKIRNLFIDHQENIWMTNHPYGLIYGNPKKTKFDIIPKSVFPSSEENYDFNNFIEYSDGTIWCSYDQGILVFNKKKELVKHFKSSDIHPDKGMVNYILKDQSGMIWAATNKGLSIYNSEAEKFKTVENTQGFYFLYLYQLENGKILASTLSNGIFEVIYNQDIARLKKNSETEKGYTSIYEDQLGQIYSCYEESKIEIFSIEADSFLLKGNLPLSGSINSFHEVYTDSTLWIGTSFGLAKIDINNPRKVLQFFTTKDSFPENNIKGILQKDANEFWISTSNGLASYNTANYTVKNYTIEDGILSTQFKDYAFLKLKNGDIWLGGSNGITIIPPKLPKDLTTEAAIIFTEFKINDKIAEGLVCQETNSTVINQMKRIQLNYDENNISLDLKVSDYSAPNGTQIKYKLEGEDDDWKLSEKGNLFSAQYFNLSSGEYNLIIKGVNSDGVWNKQRILEILIHPPIWLTWWFLTLSVFLIAAIGWFSFRYRINQIRKTSDLKARIAENKMSALVAQMNPHFIFNSLQSINSYILKNDKRQASEYLGRFSKLMRMILDNSRNATHSLNKEIELLSLYLKVEAQRFKKPFNYNITIDETIAPYDVHIPAMMLQPFVENAIWHGISNKKETGHIEINISSKNETLKCVVEDDGIGRAKAAEIKHQKGNSHQSRALEIITERLQLLYPDQQHLCEIKYIDLFDKERKPAGTRIEIHLPLGDGEY